MSNRLDASTAEVVSFLRNNGYAVHFPVDASLGEEQARVALQGDRHVIVTRNDARTLQAKIEGKPRRTYRFQDHTEVGAEHVQPIVDLLREGKEAEAAAAFHELCLSIRDLKHFKAFHLGLKIRQDSQK
jgi:virulence-associated protein VagC